MYCRVFGLGVLPLTCDHKQKTNNPELKTILNGRYPKSHTSRKKTKSIIIMETQDLVVGGWTKYHALTPEDQKVFDEAMHGFVGVKYNPQEVSTQLVNGTNYRFRCEATMPPADVVWEAIVEIYAPIHGQPHVVSIHRI